MYGPKPFLSEDISLASNLIDSIVMGTLLVSGSSLEGSPLPFMVGEAEDGKLKLIGHMDRGNPLWRSMQAGEEVLVVFWGPNAYISPSLYTTKPRVPTWVYATVHIKGIPTLIQDEDGLDSIVSNLSRFMEKPDSGWDISQVTDYKKGLLHGIVGFEIDATSVQSQVRLVQTNTDEDRAAVYKALSGGTPAEKQVAALMGKLGFALTSTS